MLHDAVHHSLEKPLIDAALQLFERMYLGCVRLTVFRNRNTWNTSWKSFVFAEIHIKIVKNLLKCYFKHLFIILAASKRAKHTVVIITPRILIPE